MSFTAQDVKELREVTGAGMMDCKKALEEAAGDRQKAIDLLRTKGLASAAKKQGRIATEGVVVTAVKGNTGITLEVNCETDFVAKNIEFMKFTNDLSALLLSQNIKTLDQLLESKINGTTVFDIQSNLVSKIGEKISVRRFEYLSVKDGAIGNYTHNGKIGVLVGFSSNNNSIFSNSAFQALMKDVCLHVAASDARFVNADEMDEGFKNKEAEIYAAQLKEQGKSEAMIPNIVKGKLSKLASEVCLLEQKFVKNPDIDVKSHINQIAKELNCSIKVEKMVKFTLGEGLEKKKENFAEEIAKLTSN